MHVSKQEEEIMQGTIGKLTSFSAIIIHKIIKSLRGSGKRGFLPTETSTHKIVLGLALAGILLLVQILLVSAVHDDDLFELGDVDGTVGSADIQGSEQAGPDWADIFEAGGAIKDTNNNSIPDFDEIYGGLAVYFIIDEIAIKNKDDSTTFSGASKNGDPISSWQWDTGNVPGKDDLVNVYGYATASAGELYLYAGLERLDPAGDSHLDIEFNQVPVSLDETPPCDGGSCSFSDTPRTDGDLLLIVDFTKGGDLALFEVMQWQADTWVSIGQRPGEGCLNGDPSDPFFDAACAFSNSGTITNGGWDSYNKRGKKGIELEPKAFTEIGVNLTKLIPGLETCELSFLAKSRSSQSFDSDLKDFAIGSFELCGASFTVTPEDQEPDPDLVADVNGQAVFTAEVMRYDSSTGYQMEPVNGVVVTGSRSAEDVVTTCTTDAAGTCELIFQIGDTTQDTITAETTVPIADGTVQFFSETPFAG
jgi:hypothetical protein